MNEVTISTRHFMFIPEVSVFRIASNLFLSVAKVNRVPMVINLVSEATGTVMTFSHKETDWKMDPILVKYESGTGLFNLVIAVDP